MLTFSWNTFFIDFNDIISQRPLHNSGMMEKRMKKAPIKVKNE